jgi:hypothetical protein
VAQQRAGELKQGDPSLRFRFGFHSLPSLRQLHMHVISQVRYTLAVQGDRAGDGAGDRAGNALRFGWLPLQVARHGICCTLLY